MAHANYMYISLSLSLSLSLSRPPSFPPTSIHSPEGQLFGFLKFYVDLLCIILPRSKLYPQCHWNTTARSSVSIADLLVEAILVDFFCL